MKIIYWMITGRPKGKGEAIVFEQNVELEMSERSTHVNLNNASGRTSGPRVTKKQRTNEKVSERLRVPSEEQELENEYYV